MSDRTRKLVTLRARTDHDLLLLVNREIERALALAGVASTRNSPLFDEAEKALTSATTLLSSISGVSQDEQLRIERKAAEIRSLLAQVPPYPNVLPASVAS